MDYGLNELLPDLNGKLEKMRDLTLLVCYTVSIVATVLAVMSNSKNPQKILGYMLKMVVVLFALSYSNTIIDSIDQSFIDLAKQVDASFDNSPISQDLLKKFNEAEDWKSEKTSWTLTNIGGSIATGLTKLCLRGLVALGSFLPLPILFIQYLLVLLLRIGLPVSLACSLLPANGFSSFAKKALSYLSWPIGFAFTNLVVKAVISGMEDQIAFLMANGEIVGGLSTTILTVFLAILIFTTGYAFTPRIMEALFTQAGSLTVAMGGLISAAGLATGIIQKASGPAMGIASRMLNMPQDLSIGSNPIASSINEVAQNVKVPTGGEMPMSDVSKTAIANASEKATSIAQNWTGGQK